jgi:hypothetical protein
VKDGFNMRLLKFPGRSYLPSVKPSGVTIADHHRHVEGVAKHANDFSRGLRGLICPSHKFAILQRVPTSHSS